MRTARQHIDQVLGYGEQILLRNFAIKGHIVKKMITAAQKDALKSALIIAMYPSPSYDKIADEIDNLILTIKEDT